ncbi:MAG TPA: YheE family protein [Ureibacillus sp.]|nr:YheE family protein [Ureibacillus sp.]
MIQHFKFNPLFENDLLPGWAISFYYKQQAYKAEYKKDGQIVWIGGKPAEEEIPSIEKMIHDLMLFHVYD